jgi:hypothetical protein
MAAELPPLPELTDEAKARLAPLYDAYAKLDQELATLPPPTSKSEHILRLKRRDEIGRATFPKIDFVSLPVADSHRAAMAAQLIIERQDVVNQTELKALIPERGWFLTSELTQDASNAAFAIVRNAINPDIAFVKSVLSAMYKLLPTNEIQKFDFAMLADRVAVVDGVRQTFGTQMICDEFKWKLYPIADETKVEALRKEMGIGITLADQLAQFATRSCPTAKYAGPIPK